MKPKFAEHVYKLYYVLDDVSKEQKPDISQYHTDYVRAAHLEDALNRLYSHLHSKSILSDRHELRVRVLIADRLFVIE